MMHSLSEKSWIYIFVNTDDSLQLQDNINTFSLIYRNGTALWDEFNSKWKFICFFQDASIFSQQKTLYYLSHLIHKLMITAYQIFNSRAVMLLGKRIKKRIKNCAKKLWWCTFSVCLSNAVNNGYGAAILNLGSTDYGDPWIDFRGSMTLDGKKITTLLSLTSNWNSAFHDNDCGQQRNSL
jgi:hypothetical protein